MSEELNTKEEPLSEGVPIVGLPLWVRIFVVIVASALLVFSMLLIWRYLHSPNDIASPRELQLSNLIMFSFSVLLLVLIPWQKLGIRIKKIGSVEFDKVINAQAKEHVIEFSELRARIEELEANVHGMDEVASIRENLTAQDLRPLLLKFLEEFQPQPYSPLRIYKWGSRQPGFEKLGQYSQGEIRQVLQSLVADGKVSTRVSQLGNTLYKIVD